ncbi:MAG: hypothetical protein ACIWVG_13540 [Gloeotrichia echinulata HAB0833]
MRPILLMLLLVMPFLAGCNLGAEVPNSTQVAFAVGLAGLDNLSDVQCKSKSSDEVTCFFVEINPFNRNKYPRSVSLAKNTSAERDSIMRWKLK